MSKKFDLESYKKTIKVAEVALKKDKFIVVDECLQEVIGMPGFPLGHITQVFGKSDTGKTSLMFHAIAQAQKQKILPIVLVTEGKIDWDRAKTMGVNTEEAIIVDNLEYIEDVFKFMDERISDMNNGDLPVDVMFFWDSIGNTLSQKEVSVDKNGYVVREKGMMVAAKALTENMRTFTHKINNTRKISYPNTAGAFFINSGYNKPPTFPGGMTSFVPYGGEKIWYGSSLVLKTSKKSKLSAKKEGKNLVFGMVSKISVEKDHINQTAMSGEFVITADAFIPNEAGAIKDYKDSHKDAWGEIELTEEANES